MRETLFARWISLPARVRQLGALLLIIGVIGTLQAVWSYRKHEERREEEKTVLIESDEQEELSGSGRESSAPRSGDASIKSDSLKLSQNGLFIESDEAEELENTKKSASADNVSDASVSEATVSQIPTPLPTIGNEAPRKKENPAAKGVGSQASVARTPASLVAEARPTPFTDILDEVPPGDPNSPVKLAHYRFVLASSSFDTSQSKENHFERVAALERLTQVACMPTLPRTLSYREPSSDPLCLAAIKRLLLMNAGSTTALCARDGIDSPTCYAADADTTFEVHLTSVEEDQIDNRGLKENIRNVKEQLSKSVRQMQSDSQMATEDKKAQLKDETVKLAKKLLSIACATRKIGVRERPKVMGQDFSRREDPYGINDFLKERERSREGDEQVAQMPDLLSSTEQGVFERPEPNQQRAPDQKTGTKKEETYEPLRLVNLISSDCESAIDSARSIDPTIALIPCAERGFYSPRCIQSLRAARDAEKRSGTARGQDYDEDKGFSRF